MPIDTLNDDVFSYIKILPQALNHVFVHPYITEAKGVLYFFSFVEVIFFFFLLLRTVLKPSADFKKILNDPLILSLITVALLNYIIIGYTVPFLGAIVRYKSSFEILFILVFLKMQDTSIITKSKLFSILSKRNSLLNK